MSLVALQRLLTSSQKRLARLIFGRRLVIAGPHLPDAHVKETGRGTVGRAKPVGGSLQAGIDKGPLYRGLCVRENQRAAISVQPLRPGLSGVRHSVCVFRTKPAGDSRGNRPPNPAGNRPLETGFPEGWPISRKGGRFSGKAAGFPESVSRADGSDVGLLRYHDSFSEERSCRTKGSPCAKSKMSYA